MTINVQSHEWWRTYVEICRESYQRFIDFSSTRRLCVCGGCMCVCVWWVVCVCVVGGVCVCVVWCVCVSSHYQALLLPYISMQLNDL